MQSLSICMCLSMQGQCPNCGTENQTYFGDIFTIAGNRETAVVDCPGCNASLTFNASRREVRNTILPSP